MSSAKSTEGGAIRDISVPIAKLEAPASSAHKVDVAVSQQPAQVIPPSVALPAGCSFVQPSSTLAVAFCQPQPETWQAKLITGLPTLIISLVALGVSLRSFFYNRSKDARARQQSIEDDFWLRKVVSPLSIEPFLKFVNQLVLDLPKAAGSTEPTVMAFWKENAIRFGEFSVAFRSLALIDDSLCNDVTGSIESIEDLLASYCGELAQHLAGKMQAVPNRDDYSGRLISSSISVFKRIKAHQRNVG